MGDIHVIYPAGGAPIVRNDGEVMASDQRVTWCFHTDDPAVQEVEVEFKNQAEHPFFAPHVPPHRYRTRVGNGCADFYGRVPKYPGATSTVIAKYTVRGLDRAGSRVFEVDPVIITPKP